MTYAIPAIYVASIVGAIAVYLMMPRNGKEPRVIGLLLGLGTIIGLMAFLVSRVELFSGYPSVYYYIFTALSAIFAVQVITHTRPVYSALYFVLLVVSAAGLLILLEAEFMAFALVLIYGGAILVTYMFVIMLATQPETAEDPETGTSYDREARSPMVAVIMGFALLACISSALYTQNQRPLQPQQHFTPVEAAGMLMGKFDTEKQSVVHKLSVELAGRDLIDSADRVREVKFVGEGDGKQLVAYVLKGGSEGVKPFPVVLDDEVLREFVPNIDRVGLNLFQSHTLGIELAGVILLLSMVGAIVLARKQVLPEHVQPEEAA